MKLNLNKNLYRKLLRLAILYTVYSSTTWVYLLLFGSQVGSSIMVLVIALWVLIILLSFGLLFNVRLVWWITSIGIFFALLISTIVQLIQGTQLLKNETTLALVYFLALLFLCRRQFLIKNERKKPFDWQNL